MNTQTIGLPQIPEEDDKLEAIENVKSWVKPGDTIYTVIRHVASSGMSRNISFFVFKNNKPICLDWHVEKILGYKRDSKHEGLKVGGCGMDMGFHVVYTLSRVLYKNEFVCIGDKCPSNDHVNGNRDYTPHVHSDAGYAIKQDWL